MMPKFSLETLPLHSTASDATFEIDVWRYHHPDATRTVYLQAGIHGIELTGIPVWVSLGSTFMDSIILPDTDRLNTIRVYADGDKAGTQAYESLKAKHGSMYNVELHQAPPGKDYNDILMAKKKEQGVSYY